MASIELKSVSDEMLHRLSRLASDHQHDLTTEALDCLERGLRLREEVDKKLQRLRHLHASMPKAQLTDEILQKAKAERDT